MDNKIIKDNIEQNNVPKHDILNIDELRVLAQEQALTRADNNTSIYADFNLNNGVAARIYFLENNNYSLVVGGEEGDSVEFTGHTTFAIAPFKSINNSTQHIVVKASVLGSKLFILSNVLPVAA